MRRVIVLCGPPGAGKTTAARQSGMAVYDRDDARWSGEQEFTAELAKLAADPTARAVVIRSGATTYARTRAAELVNATHVFLMVEDRSELISRVTKRGRDDRRYTIAGIDTWFKRFDDKDGVRPFPGWAAIDTPDLGAVSEDW